MERLAIISDIHAERVSLESTLRAIRERGISRIWCLGDVVGYGNEPLACAEIIRECCDVVLMGNHDAMAAREDFPIETMAGGVADPIQLARSELGSGWLDWLGHLPLTRNAGLIEACHASLENPGLFLHIKGPREAERHLRRQTAAIGFFGHTHVPAIYHRDVRGRLHQAPARGRFVLSAPGFYAIGAGSVAFSRDGDPRPSWLLFDPAVPSVQFCRVG